MSDYRLPVQVLLGQVAGPGIKSRRKGSWPTIVHNRPVCAESGVKVVQTRPGQTSPKKLISTVPT